MLEDKVQLTVGVPLHPEGVRGQGPVQASPVKPH